MHLFAANAVIYSKTGHWGNIVENLLRAYQEWLGTQGDFSCLNPKEKKKMWLMDEKRLYALRAPGNTCLNAIRQTEGKSGVTYAENNSKGCGTAMRAAVFGLAMHYDADTSYGDDAKAVYTYAKYDAKLTHGHPMAADASVALAFMIYEMVQRNPLRSQTLQDAIKIILQSDSELNILLRKAVSLALDPEVSDLDGIHTLGEGWIAEEALAIALFCAVRYQNDFAKAIRVSVNHKGDSDSTGAICGYILGAWLGKEAVEEAFDLGNLELRDVIEEIAKDLYYAVEVKKGNLIPAGLNAEWDAKYRR
jgi:ADP-ribosylglycohydrolase